MSRIAPALSLILAIGVLPFASFAQEADESAQTPAIGGDLALGQELGPQPGQIYARETHGDWQVRCVVAPEGQEDPCQLFQRLLDANGTPTADMNFFATPGAGPVAGGATLLAPLRTLLSEGVVLSIDESSPRQYPFAFCDEQGCYARMGFTAEEMAQFRAGNVATIQLIPALAPEQVAVLSMSLAGFTAGMQAIGAPEPTGQGAVTLPSLGDNN